MTFEQAIRAAGLHPRDVVADGKIRRCATESKPPLTAERLRELLHYDPSTGVFTRRVAAGRQPAGSVAGNSDGEGYLKLDIERRTYKAHRLAWLYVKGEWPINDIDHKDGNRVNNSIANLRDVTRQVNLQNRRRAQSNNKCGVLGVSFVAGRYMASIQSAGRFKYLGRFLTAEEAHAAYLDAKRRLHEGCTL